MLNKKLIISSYLVLAVGLTACGSGDVKDTNTQTETTTSVETKTSKDTVVKDDNNDVVIDDKTDKVIPIKEGSDNSVKTEETVTTETTQTKTEDVTQYKDIQLTATEAYNIFLDKRPNSQVEKIALDYDSKVYYYKIHGYDGTNEYETKMDAATGAVVKDKSEIKDNKNKVITAEQIDKIDEMVSNAMQDAADDFESIEWELQIDNGKPILEIDIDRNSNDLEYKYDLETGELLKKN